MERYDKAITDYDEAIRLDLKSQCAHNNRAWLLSTCPDPQYRDGKKAVESALKACDLAKYGSAFGVGTLAAAYAESGDFDSAIKWQTKAIERLDDPKQKPDFQARLKLYREKKPYREGD